jgi:hypothetical protein
MWIAGENPLGIGDVTSGRSLAPAGMRVDKADQANAGRIPLLVQESVQQLIVGRVGEPEVRAEWSK